ncbi:MAG: nickel-dependent hydrogenase large subunit, partial [Coriobacteriia bacterium]|nr:nickel-dependent hydrogenase large subunit [Coriobacteriia bacterium]
MAFYEVDPISRIEGHLGVKLDHNGSVVTDANVHGNLWRGFENFLIGREPNDAITFTQRICGVCPLPHATASTFAVESVIGYSPGYITFSDVDADGYGVPSKAVHVRNLVYASEFLMSAVTHFYHLAAPSYVQGPQMAPWTPYFADASGVVTPGTNWYHQLLKSNNSLFPGNVAAQPLWDAVIGQYVKALRIRRLTFEAGALFAGRMPMTSSFVAGGVTLQDASGFFQTKCTKFRTLMTEVGKFIVKEHVPLVLALGALYPTYDNAANGTVAYAYRNELANGMTVDPGYVSGVPA